VQIQPHVVGAAIRATERERERERERDESLEALYEGYEVERASAIALAHL
jgi:hypothetical protein